MTTGPGDPLLQVDQIEIGRHNGSTAISILQVQQFGFCCATAVLVVENETINAATRVVTIGRMFPGFIMMFLLWG